MTPGLRQALVIALGGIAWAGLIVLLAKRRLLTVRYVLGWLVIATFGLAGSAAAPLTAPLASALGMTPTGVLLAAATLVLLAITLQLSISVSGLQRRVTMMAQNEALERSLPTIQQNIADQRRSIPPNNDESSADRSSVLVVVPAWNEEPTVRSVVEKVRSAGYVTLVIDDGSTDNTRHEALAGGAAVLRLSLNCGVGAALKAGFAAAVACNFQSVVQVDADGQHHPATIDALVSHAQLRELDLTLGSRFAANGYSERVHPTRRLAMRVLSFSASRSARTTITDATSGFRVISQPLLGEFSQSFPNHYLGDTYEALVAAGRGGYRIDEQPVQMSRREVGVSSATSSAALMLTIRSLVVVLGRLQFSIRSRSRVTSQQSNVALTGTSAE